MSNRTRIIIVVLVLFIAATLATASSWEGDITDQAATELAAGGDTEGDGLLPWRIEGDLLLFFFLVGGAVAGFMAGYYWRKLFAENGRKREHSGGKETA